MDLHSRQGQVRATATGFTAVLMWSTLALFTALSGPLPPFELMTLSFTIAFLIGLALWRYQGVSIRRQLQLPWQVWLLGVGGLFGYHFFYFVAQRHAPAVEASLISYLWPLLIVLFAALLPGEKLRWYHLVGGLAGFLGAALIVSGGGGLAFDSQYGLGYAAALVAALIWSSYSVLSRLFGAVPSSAIGAFCGVTALLALVCHLLFEQTEWPAGSEWLAVLCLGLGPIGAAFYTWDRGVKRGNINVLGALSYLAPLLSTLLLIALGLALPTSLILVACALIVGGAFLAAGDFWVQGA